MAELEPLRSNPPTSVTHHRPHSPESRSSYAPVSKDVFVKEGHAPRPPRSGPSIQDILLFFGIAIMLVWPWIFFGFVWANGGLQMNERLAEVVTNNPHTTTYFITFICSITTLIVSELFSLAIIRLAQELVTYHKPTQPFHLTVLLAFRRQAWPWGKTMKDARYLMTKNRWWFATSVILCVFTFPHLMSSTTTLLTPSSFNRTAILAGSELDFSSTDDVCLAWFSAYPLSSNCTLQVYNGQEYSSCLGGTQTADILEAGRGKVLESVTNNSESLTFGRLGAGGGLHFQGSVQGVLPLGPNGIAAFNTSLESSPLSNPKIMKGMISYDYILNLQGLTSNVSCSSAQTNPFNLVSLDGNYGLVLGYNVTCANNGGIEVWTDISYIGSSNSDNLLLSWACQSAPNGTTSASYTIYLAGLNDYKDEVGNITCTVNPIQSAVYPVMYRSTGNIFSTGESTTPSPLAYSILINYALKGLANTIRNAQNSESNLFADSVITYGQQFFKPPAGQPPGQYLELYEQMIQGILEYEMTYLRLIYSTLPDPPPSCHRKVTGLLHYEVLGWSLVDACIGFLIPLTVVNLGALFALARAMVIAKHGGYMYPPSHPRQVIYDKSVNGEEQIPDEWLYKVSVCPTTTLKEYFDKSV